MVTTAAVETPGQRRDRWAWRALTIALFAVAVGYMPHAISERQRVARLLAPYEAPNANFEDAARRLSTRFNGGQRDEQAGIYRFRLQRERGLWDSVIALCGITILITGFKLGKPLWLWWRTWFSARLADLRR